MIENNALQQLSRDCYFGTCQYSNTEASDLIRKAILDELEPLPEKKTKYRNWMKRNSDALFEIITETVTPIQNELALQDLGGIVETRTFDMGDKEEYIIENGELFDVQLVATGLKHTSRQRIYNHKVQTEAFMIGLKIYTELFDFLTGKVNWTHFVDRVAKSFNRKIFTMVTGTLYASYNTGTNPEFCKQTTAAGLGAILDELIAKVGDHVGGEVVVVGTKQALGKIDNVGTVVLDDIDEKRRMGHVSVYKGSRLVELPNYYDKDLKAFSIPNDMLIVLPVDEQGIVKLGLEGDLFVEEVNEGRKDFQIEMEMSRMVHLGVAVANTYGMIKIQG